MHNIKKCKKIFFDFDGVIVDSNKFKEIAIEKSIYRIIGKNQKSKEAVLYFNINAGISREKKLSLFFQKNEVYKIMEYYSILCDDFFFKATPTIGLVKFLNYIKSKNDIKMYILSGGDKKEIVNFLNKNYLASFFEDILASEKSKSDHLKNKYVSQNDIFIGDSKNDLKASLESEINFILLEGYKSLKSFPSEKLINENVFMRTKNFTTLMNNFIP